MSIDGVSFYLFIYFILFYLFNFYEEVLLLVFLGIN